MDAEQSGPLRADRMANWRVIVGFLLIAVTGSAAGWFQGERSAAGIVATIERQTLAATGLSEVQTLITESAVADRGALEKALEDIRTVLDRLPVAAFGRATTDLSRAVHETESALQSNTPEAVTAARLRLEQAAGRLVSDFRDLTAADATTVAKTLSRQNIWTLAIMTLVMTACSAALIVSRMMASSANDVAAESTTQPSETSDSGLGDASRDDRRGAEPEGAATTADMAPDGESPAQDDLTEKRPTPAASSETASGQIDDDASRSAGSVPAPRLPNGLPCALYAADGTLSHATDGFTTLIGAAPATLDALCALVESRRIEDLTDAVVVRMENATAAVSEATSPDGTCVIWLAEIANDGIRTLAALPMEAIESAELPEVSAPGDNEVTRSAGALPGEMIGTVVTGLVASQFAQRLNQSLSIQRITAENCAAKVRAGTAKPDYLAEKLDRISLFTEHTALEVEMLLGFAGVSASRIGADDSLNALDRAISSICRALETHGFSATHDLTAFNDVDPRFTEPERVAAAFAAAILAAQSDGIDCALVCSSGSIEGDLVVKNAETGALWRASDSALAAAGAVLMGTEHIAMRAPDGGLVFKLARQAPADNSAAA